MKVDGNGDIPVPAEPGAMADKRHQAKRNMTGAEQQKRERELDAWMDQALGVRKPDPEPIVRDL
jgi:hypothetical protein